MQNSQQPPALLFVLDHDRDEYEDGRKNTITNTNKIVVHRGGDAKQQQQHSYSLRGRSGSNYVDPIMIGDFQKENQHEHKLALATKGTVWNDGYNYDGGLHNIESPDFYTGRPSVEGAIYGLLSRGEQSSKIRFQYHIGVIQADDHQWTIWFSDENNGSEQNCPNDRPLVSQIQCNFSRCDTLRLRCSKVQSNYKAITGSKSRENAFSDETADYTYCPYGYYLNGIRCGGQNCDNIGPNCVKVQYASSVDACKSITLPATYATPGIVTYTEQQTYDEQVYPLGTMATFTCPYYPLWRHSSVTTCLAGTGWDKDPVSECEFDSPESSFIVLPRSFKKCPSFMELSEENCKAAGISVGGTQQQGGTIIEGSWSNIPFGCSVGGGVVHDFDIRYNSAQGGENDGDYEPVCSRSSFTLLPQSYVGGCLSLYDVSEENCVDVALSAVGLLHQVLS